MSPTPEITAAATRRMSAAELRVLREQLGLTKEWLARDIGVTPKTVGRWEDGRNGWPPPADVCARIQQIWDAADRLVRDTVAALGDVDAPTVLTVHDRDDAHPGRPGRPWPASWHRAVCARVAQEVPGLAVDYWSDAPSS